MRMWKTPIRLALGYLHDATASQYKSGRRLDPVGFLAARKDATGYLTVNVT
jgi:hypothetical protein